MDDFRCEDLRCQIYPQSGTHRATTIVDTATSVVDGAVTADIRGAILIKAGRPQPQPAGGFATCCGTTARKCALCYCVCGRNTFPCFIGREVFVCNRTVISLTTPQSPEEIDDVEEDDADFHGWVIALTIIVLLGISGTAVWFFVRMKKR